MTYTITIFHRNINRAKVHTYATLAEACAVASEIFDATGVVVGIDEAA